VNGRDEGTARDRREGRGREEGPGGGSDGKEQGNLGPFFLKLLSAL